MNSLDSGKPTNDDRRIFLGLDQPPLASAVQWMVQADGAIGGGSGTQERKTLDLRDRLIVLPSTRARLRLLQLLVQAAEQQNLMLIPPEVISIGQLPEQLYTVRNLLASDLSQQIAWSRALEGSSEEEILALTGRNEKEELKDWQPLASLLSTLHQRLAGDILSFRSVAREVESLPGFLPAERARWEALRDIQTRYYEILTAAKLWDRQAARSVAARSAENGNAMCATSKMVVLIGIADLNRSTTEMLKQVRDQVYVLVAADPSMADRFNEFGSIITEKWLESEIPIRDSQIKIVDQPADQAHAVAICISDLDGTFAADEITVGVPDATIIPQIHRSLNSIGAKHRTLSGRSLAETAPVRLMVACREYLRSRAFSALASLVRHPDMFQWLAEDQAIGNDWLAALDAFQNSSLPAVVGMHAKHPFGDPAKLRKRFEAGDRSSEKRAKVNARNAEALNSVHQSISKLLSPLAEEDRPLADWTGPWTRVLSAVYGNRVLDKTRLQDQQVQRACEVLVDSLASQRQVPPDFGTTTSSIQALDWALEAATENRVVPPPVPGAVELAGWLDLPLDDAPVMIVTGMNDESVPSSETGHQFLPNGLCEQLEILDNKRRYARDAYALTVIAAVRENLRLIAGRRDERGEPKKPSRLLFATDSQTAAIRARAFFSFEGDANQRFWMMRKEDVQVTTQQFRIPEPHIQRPIEKLSVTKFKQYIECPYRFYLSRLLNLQPAGDAQREMDGGAFGSLGHDVLEQFGKSPVRESTDPDEIAAYLRSAVDEKAKEMFSGVGLPAVRIQVEQLKLRLDKFAPLQAARRRDGWRIVHAEELHEHEIQVDNKPFIIRGKIDRVDQHEISGQVAVWDYKTSDSGKTPAKAHLKKRGTEWVDLQLPLYRHLIKEVEEVRGADFSNMITGYVLLPKALENVSFSQFDVTQEQLAAADQKAFEVIRKLREGIFWPPAPKPPAFSEDYAPICQDEVSGQWSTIGEEAMPW